MKRTFMDKVIKDETLNLFSEIEFEINAWHRSTSSASLHEWLGMTHDEYAKYVQDASSLKSIVQSRRQES